MASTIGGDYYAILEVIRSATTDQIIKSYKKLVLIHHPDRNPGEVNATANFQKLLQAYETLKDDSLRRDYNLKYPRAGQPPPSGFSAAPEKDASPEETCSAACEEEVAESIGALEVKIAELRRKESQMSDEVFESNRKIRQLTGDLRRFQEQDEKDAELDRKGQNCGKYSTSSITEQHAAETAQEREQREQRRLHRAAATRIKQSDLTRSMNSLKQKDHARKQMVDTIEKEKQKLARLKQARDNAKSGEQGRKAWAEEQARKATESKQRAAAAEQSRRDREAQESARKEAESRQRAREQQAQNEREAHETARKEAESRRQQQEQKEREAQETARRERESWHRAETRKKNFQRRPQPSRSEPQDQDCTTAADECGHESFWDRIDGQYQCNRCHIVQKRFIYQCPTCASLACASCRKILRDEKR